MAAPLDPLNDIEAYAAISAELADPALDRDATLERLDLDEDTWETLETHWLERLSRACDTHGDEPGVPRLVAQHAAAFAAAQGRAADGLLSFAKYVQITRALRSGNDTGHTLKRFDAVLATYLKAHQHWTSAMTGDDALAQTFRRAMG